MTHDPADVIKCVQSRGFNKIIELKTSLDELGNNIENTRGRLQFQDPRPETEQTEEAIGIKTFAMKVDELRRIDESISMAGFIHNEVQDVDPAAQRTLKDTLESLETARDLLLRNRFEQSRTELKQAFDKTDGLIAPTQEQLAEFINDCLLRESRRSRT